MKTHVFKHSKVILLLSSLLLAVGCARRTITPDSFLKVSIGMDKNQVMKKLGKPAIIRGASQDKSGQIIEIFEYDVDSSSFWDSIKTIDSYWLQFCDGKLTQWGKIGDWKKEADHISEIRYR